MQYKLYIKFMKYKWQVHHKESQNIVLFTYNKCLAYTAFTSKKRKHWGLATR